MLAYNLIGFQTEDDCSNFLGYLANELGLDVEELEALHVERAPLLAALRAARPGSASQALLHRLHAASAANEAIACRQSRVVRERLAHIGSGRRAINAYAPGGGGDAGRSVAWLDRAG